MFRNDVKDFHEQAQKNADAAHQRAQAEQADIMQKMRDRMQKTFDNIDNAAKEKKDREYARQTQRDAYEHELQMQRERQAHELAMAKLRYPQVPAPDPWGDLDRSVARHSFVNNAWNGGCGGRP